MLLTLPNVNPKKSNRDMQSVDGSHGTPDHEVELQIQEGSILAESCH